MKSDDPNRNNLVAHDVALVLVHGAGWTGSAMADTVIDAPCDVAVYFHNITPAAYFERVARDLPPSRLERAKREVRGLLEHYLRANALPNRCGTLPGLADQPAVGGHDAVDFERGFGRVDGSVEHRLQTVGGHALALVDHDHRGPVDHQRHRTFAVLQRVVDEDVDHLAGEALRAEHHRRR